MRIVVACVCSAILGGLVSGLVVRMSEPVTLVAQDSRRGPGILLGPGASSGRSTSSGNSDSPSLPSVVPELWQTEDQLSVEEQISVAVYELVNRGVVNITTKSVRTDNLFMLEVPEEGAGSGIVLDRAGHVLTNYHVIQDVREVVVTLHNGETYDATFVGADPVNDLAVIRVEAPFELLHPVRLGDSSSLKVGMNVYAIGNPFGLERTLTRGIISSLNRSLKIHGDRSIKSIIQIDAAVNPGNSGGPVLDSHGRMIGINTAIYSKTGQSAGVGFAIPINLVKRVVPQLIRHGRVIRPEIGISRVYETEKGLLVAQLTSGGPAEAAGLKGPEILRERRGPFVVERVNRKAADLIVALEGEKITTVDDFLGDIESRNPGDVVQITVLRQGKEVDIPVKLGGGVVSGTATPRNK